MSFAANRHRHIFCPRCQEKLEERLEGGLQRPFCTACGYVQYMNPAPGAGVIIRRGKEICLVQRKFPPKVGQWTLPTGFMEWDESIQETAVREVAEETGLEVELTGLYAAKTGILPPDQPVLVVFFEARETGGELQAGDDADAVEFFSLDKLPAQIAFATHRDVLNELTLREKA